MTTVYASCQMWLVTGWEEEYEHRVMFANQEDAYNYAERWKDDLFESVKVEQVDIMSDDQFPF